MNLIMTLGVVAFVLIWAVRNTKVRRTTKVAVPPTPAERLRAYTAQKVADDEALKREVMGRRVIEAVLLREKPTGPLGEAIHAARDAERAARGARTDRPGKRHKGVLKLVRAETAPTPTAPGRIMAHKGK